MRVIPLSVMSPSRTIIRFASELLLKGVPLFVQVMVGRGIPYARHARSTVLPEITVIFPGASNTCAKAEHRSNLN